MDYKALFIPTSHLLSTIMNKPNDVPPPFVTNPIEIHRTVERASLDPLLGMKPRSIIPKERLCDLGICKDKMRTVVPLQRTIHPDAIKILNLGKLFGPDGPRITDVNQGLSGDCYLLAVLASMAEKTPNEIVDLFEPVDAAQNDFWVKYYCPQNGERKQMRVYDTSYINKHRVVLYAGDPTGTALLDQVSWVKVTENWFAKANEIYEVAKPGAGFNGISLGGYPSVPFKILTGREMEMIRPESIEDFEEIIKQANEGSVLVLGTKANTFSRAVLPGRHAYAVIEAKDNEVILYNPWGSQIIIDKNLLFENTGTLWLGEKA